MAQSSDLPTISGFDGLFRRIQQQVQGKIRAPVEFTIPGERTYRLGKGEPKVKVVVNDPAALGALRNLDELKICEAYVNGSLEIAGDMLSFVSLRRALRNSHPLYSLWSRLTPWLIGRLTSDRLAIATHYDFPCEFYLRFLGPTRCYSQALFERDDEALETAQQRKLDFAIDACHLKPGDHVLDVGGGWGSFVEHAGQRGIRVTALTISRQSEQFLTDLIARRNLPCRVRNEDFLEHTASEPYDAIVILGVMEHLPDYPAVLRQLQRLLKPGGHVYLDASASQHKYAKPAFISRYVFPADHAYLCLHDFLTSMAKTPLELLAVHNDRHSYFLTCKAWSENLEAARSEITCRWGQALYRCFRLYLWGSAYAFRSHSLEAFRVVIRSPGDI
ncbi:class I SAM-dependent methyltransferase [Methylotetracoccus oryzae]|uniref:class I SAM-dependent methyltransferase n=1 Tax=Methylotetracoccus oryzae TaxID=1919059 RepID=UPI00111A4AD2|nr:class I SAM-dependent methyltransferase [Methylotetracoccus oryzae]